MPGHHENRTILVTGGAGYIGSHVCRSLAASGYRPVVYDNLSQGHAWAVRWGDLEVGDILDTPRLETALKQHSPFAVIHLAGLIAAGDSVVDPIPYYRNNLIGTLSLLEAMRACSIHRLVFSSTAGVYGEPELVPIPETHPLRPVNPYGATKMMVERMIADAAPAFGLRSVALRYFNAVGAAAEDGIGEAHQRETHLLPLVLEAAAGLRPFIEIYGGDFPTHDGSCIRDYVHVCDLADAHLLALAYLDRASGPEVFNLGSETAASVREVIETARRVTGAVIEVRQRERRPGDPAVLVADSTRAKKILGWTPGFASLEQQVTTAWQWHQRYHPADERRSAASH